MIADLVECNKLKSKTEKGIKTFNGILENADEERWLTTVKAKEMDMLCCTAPNTLVSHFLYGPQRSNDNMLDILVKYKDISNV